MALIDECHHCGSNTSVEVMQKINARYVYGVSATPKRSDNLGKIIHMLLGSVRHSSTAKEAAERFTVIDDELVWHGATKFLGKADAGDNLMRIKSTQVAAELLEMALKKEFE